MNQQIQRTYGFGTAKGVLLTNLVEGGPAESAGLRAGDIILEINGTAVQEPNDIEKSLAKHKPTDTATIKILRGRKPLSLPVKLEELPRLEHLPQGII
jgi:S1-C subfamily serine protease